MTIPKDPRLADMVKHQLAARGIVNKRVLDAIGSIERHLFVPVRDFDSAYDDRPLFIGSGQTISQPYIVALMTELLDVKEDNRVLEIGTGSGYQTAILARLGSQVYTVERIDSLQQEARERLEKLEYTNIKYLVGDGTLGWQEHAPYERIMVTAAAPDIPVKLFEQLAIGGRMVAPVGGKFRQELKLVLKIAGGKQKVMNRGGCLFVPLIGREGWTED